MTRISIVVRCLLCALAIGCGVDRPEHSMPLALPHTFSDSGDATVSEKWWRVFDDKQLDSLVDEALTANFDLAAAWERLQAAEAIVRRSSGGRYPDLELSLESGLTAPGIGDDEGVTLGLKSEFEIDFWGRIRAGVEAERLRATTALADYRTVALTLSAETTLTWYRLMETHLQQSLLDTQVETNEAVLRLIKTRLGTEQIRMVDVLRQRQLVEVTKEQRIAAEGRAALLTHQLAILIGQPPKNMPSYKEGPLPELPPLPETGIPSELLQRRPDVQAAYYRLMAADRDLAVAVAQRFPRLTITAEAAVMLGGSGSVIRDWLAAIVGNLLVPIFKGGALKAEQERTAAIERQRVNEYGQVILAALREVEDALVRETKQRDRIESLEKQIEFISQTQSQLHIEFLNGVGDYLDTLLTLTQEQQLRRDLIAARLDLVIYRVALYRALSGGFETSREAKKAKKTE